jgi:hypothetical protein
MKRMTLICVVLLVRTAVSSGAEERHGQFGSKNGTGDLV